MSKRIPRDQKTNRTCCGDSDYKQAISCITNFDGSLTSDWVKGAYVLMCEDKCYCNDKWYYNHAQSNLCFPSVL